MFRRSAKQPKGDVKATVSRAEGAQIAECFIAACQLRDKLDACTVLEIKDAALSDRMKDRYRAVVELTNGLRRDLSGFHVRD